jgi:hypothetical protein
MSGLTQFEQQVIDAFLAGADPRLDVLREQMATCVVTGREHTGVGSFTHLHVASQVPRLIPSSITLDDVHVEVEGLKHNATALLFVRDGIVVMLEFATGIEAWPFDPKAKRISYLRYVEMTGGYTLVPTPQRDPETLAILLSGGPTVPPNNRLQRAGEE